MIQIGVDTSLLIGLLDSKDLWHAASVALYEKLVDLPAEILVFDCVLAEAISSLARRVHEQRRSTDLQQLLEDINELFPSDNILWVLPDVPTLYRECIDLVRTSGGELNFNDALIALSCRNRDIPLLASFDRDFDAISWLKRVAQPDDFQR